MVRKTSIEWWRSCCELLIVAAIPLTEVDVVTAPEARTTAEWAMDVGGQVRRLRLGRELTQEQLARGSNVSRHAVRSLETGQGSSLETLIKVLRALDREDWLASLAPVGPTVSPMQLLQRRRAHSARSRDRHRARRGGGGNR
jgi:transcriptional regulator with XRE-family HTH domain